MVGVGGNTVKAEVTFKFLKNTDLHEENTNHQESTKQIIIYMLM